MSQSRWLALARRVWIVIAVFYIGAYLFTLPIRLTEMPSFDSTEITQADFLAGLAQMGVSPETYILYRQITGVFVPLAYMGLSLFIFWRKSNDWMAIFTSLLFILFWSPFGSLARLNAGASAGWTMAGNISDVLSSIALFLWFFVFPDGRFVPRWTRWLFLVLLATQVWRIFQPDLYERSFAYLGPIFFGAILIGQVYRYRHASTAQRQQIKWVVYGIVMGTLPLLVFFLFYFAVFAAQPPLIRVIVVNFFGALLWNFFVILLPISLTLAILRSRLFDIDLLIRRTLVYSVVSGLLALAYFGLIVVLQGLFAAFGGGRSEFITVISTLAIAALFFSIRNRVQDFVDRRFYRRKYDAAKTLAEFAKTARDEVELEKLTGRLVQVVDETMQPSTVALHLQRNEGAAVSRRQALQVNENSFTKPRNARRNDPETPLS